MHTHTLRLMYTHTHMHAGSHTHTQTHMHTHTLRLTRTHIRAPTGTLSCTRGAVLTRKTNARGAAGAATVASVAVNACLRPLVACDGMAITTTEASGGGRAWAGGGVIRTEGGE